MNAPKLILLGNANLEINHNAKWFFRFGNDSTENGLYTDLYTNN